METLATLKEEVVGLQCKWRHCKDIDPQMLEPLDLAENNISIAFIHGKIQENEATLLKLNTALEQTAQQQAELVVTQVEIHRMQKGSLQTGSLQTASGSDASLPIMKLKLDQDAIKLNISHREVLWSLQFILKFQLHCFKSWKKLEILAKLVK